MQLLYDMGFGQKRVCHVIEKIGNIIQKDIQEQVIFDVLAEQTSQNSDIYVLLEHEHFDFVSFDIMESTGDEIFGIQKLEQHIQEKLGYIKSEYGFSQAPLLQFLDTAFVNGEKTDFILGKRGHIFFRISFVFLKGTTKNILHMKCGSCLEKNRVHIYPASFFTINFIKKSLEKQSFYILYIYEDYAKLLHIHNGSYKIHEKVNVGMNMLKEIYKDNGIYEYFYTKKADIQEQPVIKNIINQSVEFFTQMLSKRLSEYIAKENDLILISPLTKNIFFQQHFNERYNHYINGYILPFHTSNTLKTFDTEWSSDEMDMLIFANTYKDIDERML